MEYVWARGLDRSQAAGFNDGSYEAISTFMPPCEEYEAMPEMFEQPELVKKKITGKMTDEAFSRIRQEKYTCKTELVSPEHFSP